MTDPATGEKDFAPPESWAKAAAEKLGADAAVIIVFRRPVDSDHECNFRSVGAAVSPEDREAVEEWRQVLENEMESGFLVTPSLQPGNRSPQRHKDTEQQSAEAVQNDA